MSRLANMKHVAVVQPLPGIGDMIWHLPHIRAIARYVGSSITLIAKPRSAATELFSAETTIHDIIPLDRNPDQQRGRNDGLIGFMRLVGELRSRSFDAVVLLHHSRTLAAATFVAGVPHRFGYGFGLQRLFLNCPPYLHGPQLTLHPYDQATAWLTAAGIPLEQAEPCLPVAPENRAAVRQRLGEPIAPFVAIGIGTSEPYKQWGERRFAALAAALLDHGWSRLMLVCGPAEASLADTIRQHMGDRSRLVQLAVGWKLGELAALLADAAFYIGNDTGVMNLAAAVGTRSYGLFGATPPFHHASAIVPILPPDGRIDIATGMARITVEAALDRIRTDRGTLAPASDLIGINAAAR